MNRLSRPRWRATTSTAFASLALALALGSGAAARAQESDYRLFDRASFVIGSFFESTDTTLRLDGGVSDLGVPIDFEGELGLDSSDTLFRVRAEFLAGERHLFTFGYYALDREATRRLTRNIEFGGKVYPVNADVTAFTDIDVYEGSYTWWFARQERFAFGGTLGLVYFGVDAGIGVEALGTGVGVESSASTDLPAPVVGLAFRGALLRHLNFVAHAEFLPSVTVGDVDGSMTNLSAGLEYRPFEHVGFGAEYNLLDLDVDVDKTSYHGTVNYRIEGAQLYLRLGF